MCISCNHAPASPGAYPRALHTHSPLRLFKCCQPLWGRLRGSVPSAEGQPGCRGPEHHGCLFPAIIHFMHRRNSPSLSTLVTSRTKIMYLFDGWKIWSCVKLKGMTSAGKAVSDKGKKEKQSFPCDCSLCSLYSISWMLRISAVYSGYDWCSNIIWMQTPCLVLLALKFKKDT